MGCDATAGAASALNLNFACGEKPLWDGFDNSDIEPYSASSRVRHVDLDDPPYPYDDESADLIMMSHGLCLREDREGIVREFFRILKPGGWLRLDDNPHRFYVEGVPVPEVEVRRGFPDERKMRRKDLLLLLHDAGFGLVVDLPAGTLIPADDDTRYSILNNRNGHESFAVEAQK